jgi:hypothetical protein
LLETPYLLVEGQSVFCAIQAFNSIGASPISNDGNGGNLVLSHVPSEPYGLSKEWDLTTTTEIGLMWNAPNFDGGQSILDYRVWFDQGTNSFAVLAENVVTLPFVATPVVKGNTYKFKVQARNSVGYSAFSDEFSVTAATIPSQPAQPTTSLTDNLLTVKWTQPAENGQVITSYQVYIK